MAITSHNHKTPVDCLSPYTRDSGSGGPTPTFTTQKRFAQRLRGVLRKINAAIRRGVIENDIFQLTEPQDTLQVEDPPAFETESNPQKVAAFVAWLREQLDTELLTIVGPDRNEFVQKAYLAGLRQANAQIRDLDVAFQPEGADSVVDAPIHVSSLQELYSRTYSNLQSLRDDLINEVRQTLLEGFREGEGPNKIARRLTDRVDKIGKHRATLIARSEVIDAHSEGTLTRIDEVQEETPEDSFLTTTHGDWDAANDTRTCPFCRAMDGVRLTTSEMRSTVVTVTSPLPGELSQVGQSFRLKPPAHPNGRCNIGIRVGGEITESLEDRLPDELRILA